MIRRSVPAAGLCEKGVSANSFPLGTTLSGTSVNVIQGNTTVAAIPVCVSNGQINIQPNRFYGGIPGVVVGLAGWGSCTCSNAANTPPIKPPQPRANSLAIFLARNLLDLRRESYITVSIGSGGRKGIL